MSRIGNLPITIPEGVSVKKDQNTVHIQGAKGEEIVLVPHGISLAITGQKMEVARVKDNDPHVRALHGFARAELQNAISGVSKGWAKTLELSGVGYRATLEGATLVLTVGFSHPVKIAPPTGITFAVEEGKIITSGTNKQLVGQTAASIREIKKPEPYKGKGIKYLGEKIRKKAGKAAKAIGGAPAGGVK